jgi:hypothetical protein
LKLKIIIFLKICCREQRAEEVPRPVRRGQPGQVVQALPAQEALPERARLRLAGTGALKSYLEYNKLYWTKTKFIDFY